MRIVGLTVGSYNLGDSVEVLRGVRLEGGHGDQDTPTRLRYQDGADPDTFPLVRGNDYAPPLKCPDCGRVLGENLPLAQVGNLFLECPEGGGLDLP